MYCLSSIQKQLLWHLLCNNYISHHNPVPRFLQCWTTLHRANHRFTSRQTRNENIERSWEFSNRSCPRVLYHALIHTLLHWADVEKVVFFCKGLITFAFLMCTLDVRFWVECLSDVIFSVKNSKMTLITHSTEKRTTKHHIKNARVIGP
jgi:hypothetical protein